MAFRPDPFFSLIKGSNGGVAVGLPHSNSSVFKQANINQWEVKVVEVRKADPPSAVGGLTVIDKRVGSWGKKVKVKAHGPRSMGLLFFNDER